MAKKHSLTRAELNEISWSQRKLKKLKGRSSGSRSNPNQDSKVASKNSQQATTKSSSKPVAIPLFIKGREQPLVGKNVSLAPEPAPVVEEKLTSGVNEVVIMNGKLVSSEELAKQAKASRKQSRNSSPSQATKVEEPASEAKVLKLGKAALRQLERAGVAPGEEEAYFASLREEKKAKRPKEKSKQPLERSAIKTRDYKAGVNTDYSQTQAKAEKAIAEKRSKRKLSAEELLDAWENTSW